MWIGKNLHQGQAIGNDLLTVTDTEEECISLLIFFDFHNHFIIIANLRKVFMLQYRRVFIQWAVCNTIQGYLSRDGYLA